MQATVSLSSQVSEAAWERIRHTILEDHHLLTLLKKIKSGAPVSGGADERLEQLIGDSAAALGLLEGYLQKNQAILEIGGGCGITHAILKMLNYRVISIEPALAGHESAYDFGKMLLEKLGLDTRGWLSLTADQLDPRRGRYDLIFSSSVLEHISDFENSLKAMTACLASDGFMRHYCPNYFIPYDPHYSIWLFPFSSKWTEIFHPELKDDEFWKGLHFVTAFELWKTARKLNLEISFDRGSLSKSLERFETDPVFSHKHNKVSAGFEILKKSGLLALLRWIPDLLLTPMQVTLRPKP